jgi:hypothetical protein
MEFRCKNPLHSQPKCLGWTPSIPAKRNLQGPNHPSTQHCKPIPIIRYPTIGGLQRLSPGTARTPACWQRHGQFLRSSKRLLLTVLDSSRQNSYQAESASILHTSNPPADFEPIRQPLPGVHMTGPLAVNLTYPAGRGPRPVTSGGLANHIERPRFRVYTPLKPWCSASLECQRHGRAVGIT